MTMNSCMSVESLACFPPLIILSIGTGSTNSLSMFKLSYKGSDELLAFAFAFAREIAKIELAPRLLFVDVPSVSMSIWSKDF